MAPERLRELRHNEQVKYPQNNARRREQDSKKSAMLAAFRAVVLPANGDDKT
jgi:hypothetical protein